MDVNAPPGFGAPGDPNPLPPSPGSANPNPPKPTAPTGLGASLPPLSPKQGGYLRTTNYEAHNMVENASSSGANEKGRMVSLNDPFWTFDFDDAYFHSDDDDMDSSGCVMIWMSVIVIMTRMSVTR
nr:hypothetical protein CFP56_41023 [Quercus suber]